LRQFHLLGTVEGIESRKRSCPHVDCLAYREGAHGKDGRRTMSSWYKPFDHYFTNSKAFQDHMRQAHNEAPFSCLAPDCELRKGKGYFRLRDLEKHHAKEHPELINKLVKTDLQWREIVPPYFLEYVPWGWRRRY
jgi:hypothetical protein